VIVDIRGTEVNQQRCWIRALELDSTREEAWLRLGENLARSGSESRAIIRGKTYSAVYCFARVAPMENSTVQCGQRGDAWLLLGFRHSWIRATMMKTMTTLLTPTTPHGGRTVHVRSVLRLSRSARFARAAECGRTTVRQRGFFWWRACEMMGTS
jgi:hypothetical protein